MCAHGAAACCVLAATRCSENIVVLCRSSMSPCGYRQRNSGGELARTQKILKRVSRGLKCERIGRGDTKKQIPRAPPDPLITLSSLLATVTIGHIIGARGGGSCARSI